MGPVAASATPPPWPSASTRRSSAATLGPRALQLSAETVSKLEHQEKKPCEKAILTLKLPKGGTATVRRVEITSAYVRLTGGSADFLDEGPTGWRVSAAGCKPGGSSDQPYDCELEA